MTAGEKRNVQLLLKISDLAFELYEDAIHSEKTSQQISTTLLQIVRNAVFAHEQLTGQALDLSRIYAEAAA
jgi:hypothetical protein